MARIVETEMMTIYRLANFVLATLIILGGGAADAQSSPDDRFEFSKPIVMPPIEESEMIVVALGDDVYDATNDDFSDVRLLDKAQTLTPFLIRSAGESRIDTQRQSLKIEKQTARPMEDGGLEIILTLEKDQPAITGLRLVSSLRNFEHRVRVDASPDGTQWTPIAEDGLIFDYSRFIDVRNDSVTFAAASERSIRIVIDDVTAEQESRLLELTRSLRQGEQQSLTERFSVDRRPFRVDAVEIWSDIPRRVIDAIKRVPVEVASVEVDHDADRRVTTVAFETRRQPLTRVTLRTESKNFNRPVRLEVPPENATSTRWRTVTSGVLSSLEFKSLAKNELSLSFPESRHARYRLVIENGDNPPLDVQGVAADASVKEMIFLAAPKSEWAIIYGNPKAKMPGYDVAVIRQALSQGFESVPATLGPQSPYIAATGPMTWRDLANNRWLLLGVISVLVVTLGWVLYQAAGRVERLVDGEPPAGPPSV
jgi:hypothetical protein